MYRKRILGILTSLALVVGTTNVAFASIDIENNHILDKGNSQKVIAYVKPSFAVQINEQLQIFRDAKGQRVYPVVYDGSTYLPVRAIAAIMDEEIEWDNYSKTIFIGKTLNNPNKSNARKTTDNENIVKSVDKDKYIMPTWKSASTMVSVRKDITIMYDFQIQEFKDESGNRVYPIIYNDSTYLPIRAIAGLMKQPITWNTVTKTILIGDGELDEEEEDITIYTERLKAEFENAVELYDQATDQITNLQNTTDVAVKNMIADSITSDVHSAENQTSEIRNMKKSRMTDEERSAQQALLEFSKISEHYLLVLENIAYLAAKEKDYSMLSDTFLNLALASQKKMNEARDLIDAL